MKPCPFVVSSVVSRTRLRAVGVLLQEFFDKVQSVVTPPELVADDESRHPEYAALMGFARRCPVGRVGLARQRETQKFLRVPAEPGRDLAQHGLVNHARSFAPDLVKGEDEIIARLAARPGKKEASIEARRIVER